MKVFFIPGLGADKSVFQFLDLDFCEPVHIEWLKPAPGETLADYAIRLQQKFIPEDAVVIFPPPFSSLCFKTLVK